MRLYSSTLLASAMLLMLALTGCNSTEIRARSAAPNNNPAAEQPGSAPTPAQAAPADNVRRISIADARAEFDGGKAIIVDVRGELAYKQGHIKGAQSIALGDLTSHIGEFPKDKTIILYCSCPAEHSSVAGGQMLHNKGVDNTAALVGGYPAWKSAGYPVEEETAK